MAILIFCLFYVIGYNSTGIAQPSLATPTQVAAYWDTVFNGQAPMGVPPLNPSARQNFRVIDNVSLWEIYFDSYEGPNEIQPYRQRAVFGIPNNISAPGPVGKYPGLISNHSVGVADPRPGDAEGEATAIWFAKKGFATLAMYTRKYNKFEGRNFDDWCPQVVGQTRIDYYQEVFPGLAVDMYQAAEWMALQAEVWQPDSLAYIGHSGGGVAGMYAGIFNERYKILAISAPPFTSPDVVGWVDYMGVITKCGQNQTVEDMYRMTSFIGPFQAINNPFMTAINPDWNLDNTHIFIYGGQNDAAVSPVYLDSTYKFMNNSNCKAFHWSPTGGHGGYESFDRTQAWLEGHYLGRTQIGPIAIMEVTSINGRSFTFSGIKSTDNDTMISWEWDFGDGITQNWGPTITHIYAIDGSYQVQLIVTDGACLRDTAQLTVNPGGVTVPDFIVSVTDTMWITEGQSDSLSVSLTVAPASNVSVTVSRVSGDPDLIVQSGGSLTFTTTNWNQPQTVVIAAAQDSDQAHGLASFSITATGIATVISVVSEIDDDVSLSLEAGTISGSPGDTVEVPITLFNLSSLRINSIQLTINRNQTILINPQTLAGPQLPLKDDWSLTQQILGNGDQLIDARQFAGPEFRPVNGLIFYAQFVIEAGTPADTTPVTIVSASINGSLSPVLVSGTVIVNNNTGIRLPKPNLKGRSAFLSVSPAPLHGAGWLHYSTPNPALPMAIRLLDSSGKFISILFEGIPGRSNGKINLGTTDFTNHIGLKNGIFFVELKTGTFQVTQKLLLLY